MCVHTFKSLSFVCLTLFRKKKKKKITKHQKCPPERRQRRLHRSIARWHISFLLRLLDSFNPSVFESTVKNDASEYIQCNAEIFFSLIDSIEKRMKPARLICLSEVLRYSFNGKWTIRPRDSEQQVEKENRHSARDELYTVIIINQLLP